MVEAIVPNVRTLTADDLGVGVRARAAIGHSSSAPDTPDVSSDHPRIGEIIALGRQYGGVILSGPPGTSKSFFAAEAARTLTQGDPRRSRFVQFHASFQYEDFIYGFTPTTTGFEPKHGHFLKIATDAAADPSRPYALVIDELSRADVGRVFGEALTYVESSKREISFPVASGVETKVPSNLIIIATMNPFDRGVDEVDAAFERRFAKISLEPNREILEEFLTNNDMEERLQDRVIAWFLRINAFARSNPAAAVGHTYFFTASDEDSLKTIWEYQLRHLVERAFRRDHTTRDLVEAGWNQIFRDNATEGG